LAKRTIIRIFDDLDGGEANNTLVFGWDGRQYEIDLTDENAKRFEEAIAPFLEAARMVGRLQLIQQRKFPRALNGAPAVATFRDREQTAAMRRWANANGYEVSDRGRIPGNVEEAFHKAHEVGIS